ncbi:MAG: Stp1/IreP family PP2C-type Ser/Thr phosphatase [Clostridiales Family XIII bacterium]|jgi:protein phosphatase|nr:Stp1/IreP family PP2C-type Ser/Thr phosphatase [Clostridiales Family XIII bacterium]
MINVGFKTDVGRRRDGNEDALLVLPKYSLFAVADGVGGRSSGEIASRKAINGIEDFLKTNPIDKLENMEGKYRHNWFKSYFLRCFRKINNDILDVSLRDPEKEGMATTAVVAYVDGDVLYIINIGDSRAYILRDGEIGQLTEDHTYVNKLIDKGMLTKSEARLHPQKNMITRALGVINGAEPDFFHYDIRGKDRVLLCTDGLHGELTDEEIRDTALAEQNLNAVCRNLVREANNRGGNDNITVVCLEI